MSKNSKAYYKIVDGHLKSMNNLSRYKYLLNYVVQYKYKEWVEAKIFGSSLFVFDSLSSVSNFLYSYPFYQESCDVYKVAVENIRKNKMFVCPSQLEERLPQVLKMKRNKKKYTHLLDTNIPRGTVTVERVKLLEFVGSGRDVFDNRVS